VLGRAYVDKDTVARLLLYRGDLGAEWAAYRPDTEDVLNRFVAGINAYIYLATVGHVPMPAEFEWLGYAPTHWSPGDVVRIRTNGSPRNIAAEIARTYTVCQYGLGVDVMRQVLTPDWTTRVREGLDPCEVPLEGARTYALGRSVVDFCRARQFQVPGALAAPFAAPFAAPLAVPLTRSAIALGPGLTALVGQDLAERAGSCSSNWVVGPGLTASERSASRAHDAVDSLSQPREGAGDQRYRSGRGGGARPQRTGRIRSHRVSCRPGRLDGL
jgi:acyl-homoserine lactone acylase PvdQ